MKYLYFYLLLYRKVLWGVAFILSMIFMTLKLCHQIDWSWWYVWMPLWGSAFFVLIVSIYIGIKVTYEA
jgi:hypothetical protein